MSEPVRRCCFTEAVSRRVAGCAKAHKSVRQYRRTAYCLDGDAHDRCTEWLDRLRQATRFVMGTPRLPSALRRSAARKLQCGGLLGLGEALEGRAVKRIEDVSRLLPRAMSRYHSLADVPMAPVIRRVQQYGGDSE